MKIYTTFLLAFMSSMLLGQIQSPQEYLVTGYGKHFTPHHLLVEYAYHLAENSDYMTIERYGYTNEKRPLLLATYTSPSNRAKLEDIRKSNLANVGTYKTNDFTLNEKAIIWLSFGVHGNEAGGPESSMNVMFRLANPDAKTKTQLEESVVLLDPSVNPDGFSRYSHWIWREAGKDVHPKPDDREHMEPWPGGRVNHYLFDLNRDWAWQTQVETQQRMIKYNQWMPHIHVDFHEMGHNSHYYFAPAAKPYHSYITDWQRDFQVDIGRNHAKYFDKEGWMYFTRENFDLFYPSYGDTYPTFNGAIGMTYEKGGHGRAGRAIEMNNGDILTLQDRIDHHSTTALSTIEVTVNNKAGVVKNFKQYFHDAVHSPKGKFKSYVIKKSESQAALAELLKRNHIQFSYSDAISSAKGYNYFTKKDENVSIEKGDMIIDVKQPKSTLIQVFMEPEHMLEDSLTYDITAWSLPFAYGVQAYGLNKSLSIETVGSQAKTNAFNCSGGNYAYYFEWGAHNSHKVLSAALKADIHLRLSSKDAKFSNKKIGKATLVAVSGDNKHLEDFDKTMQSILKESGVVSGCLSTGFSENGMDLGGGNFSLLKNPRVLTISGERVGANAFGQIWNFFENHLDYPLSIVDIDNFGSVDLSKFDVFVMPDGYYSLPKTRMDEIDSWVRKGGKLIAIGGALRSLSSSESFALSKYATDDEKKEADKAMEKLELRERLESYDGQERRSIRNSVPGAIIKNKIDGSHPLAFGLGDAYYSLKTSSATYNILKDAWNVIYVPENPDTYGFIGSRLREKIGNTVTFAVEDKGRGSVIYMADNPLYRGFWHSGLHVFTNALFLVD